MVAHYETEQSKLQNDLHDAYTLIKKEEQKRLQLEEAMRKMFVKNMNTMNMEALSIFQSINKFDPTDVLSVQQAYQQHQQAALNAMMAAATATPEGYPQPPSTGGGSMAGPVPADNGGGIPTQYPPDSQQSAATSSNPNALPRSDSVSSMAPPPPAAAMAMATAPTAGFADSSNQQGNPLYLAQLSQPPMYSSNQVYGMFSPGPPPPSPPPPHQAVYSTYQPVSMQQQQQMFAGQQDTGANSQPPMGVRFELSGTPSGSTFATPMKPAQAGIYEMGGNVQDREYLDRLAEQYRQSTSATARFAQNVPPGATYQPQGVPQPSMSTPMRPMSTGAGPQVSAAASSLGSYPTPQGAQSGAGAPSFLSGYSIRRK